MALIHTNSVAFFGYARQSNALIIITLYTKLRHSPLLGKMAPDISNIYQTNNNIKPTLMAHICYE